MIQSHKVRISYLLVGRTLGRDDWVAIDTRSAASKATSKQLGTQRMIIGQF